jgi:hypothetical protein
MTPPTLYGCLDMDDNAVAPHNGVTTMDRMTLDVADPIVVMHTEGLHLTLEETQVLHAVWSCAERVDWAVYEQLRDRVLAWPSPASHGRE